MSKTLVRYSVKTRSAGIVYASSEKRAKELQKKFGGTIRKWKSPRWV